MSWACEEKLATVEFRRASNFISFGCIAIGVIVGLSATFLLEPFSEKLNAMDHHNGMTFRWTVLLLNGIGLAAGTIMGLLFNTILSRFREQVYASANLNL